MTAIRRTLALALSAAALVLVAGCSSGDAPSTVEPGDVGATSAPSSQP